MKSKTNFVAGIMWISAVSLSVLPIGTRPILAEAETVATSVPANLSDLAFAGEVVVTAPSVHSPKYYLTVSNQESTYGTGLQLFVRQFFPEGMCTSFTVFNTESNELTQVSSFGNPGCGSVEASAPTILKQGDSGYAAALAELTAFIRQVSQGFYGNSAPEPRLVPTLNYLEQVLKSASN